MPARDPRDIARELYGMSFPTIEEYVRLLAGPGIDRGLLGPREEDRLWDRHVLNSAAVGTALGPAGVRGAEAMLDGDVPGGSPVAARGLGARSSAVTVADVGSGAGLPGVPLAVLRPELSVTLIEPLLRRRAFLTEVVAELGLADRVEVVRARADEVADRRFDVVTCRAVAPLDRLVPWCQPLLSATGEIVALKGRSAADEVAAAAGVLARAGLAAEVESVRAHPDADPATVVRVRAG